MAAELPALTEREFVDQLQSAADPLPAGAASRLYRHYRLLRRWSRSMSLIGPGTAPEAVGRHYRESLAGLPWVRDGGTLLDVGSGAGFPGFVLAAVEPSLDVVLADSRAKKCAFLRQAADDAGVAVAVVHARIDVRLPRGLPDRLDFLTLRAVALMPRQWQALDRCLTRKARILSWSARSRSESLPADWVLVAERPLAGARERLLRVFERSARRDDSRT